ncbi:MAG: hydrogenase nickel incorporation protein HypB [Hydrogenophilus sp.]|nr:hydrogenase nickel incorporation protein HypB [Hydrogenophilus sp.]
MCTTCGCNQPTATIDGAPVAPHPHTGETFSHHPPNAEPLDGVTLNHPHHHSHNHSHSPSPSFLPSPNDSTRLIQLEQAILAKNDRFAAANRARFAAQKILALNLISSPGAGKTTLLVKTIEQLRGKRPVAVIEGDQETRLDAERIRETGAPAVQINTGKGCHLDAHLVGHALDQLSPPAGTILFIENVGNLVCPALFDLGEAAKVVIFSVTEGDDKPYKYPTIFRNARLLLLNKIDLLPYLDFDLAAATTAARRVNPFIEIIPLSAKSGEGFDAWIAWIERGAAALS